MKASSRPFKSKYNSGRCGICKRRIIKDQLIVKLEIPIVWIQSKLIPHGRGKFYRNEKTSAYAHAECLEELNGKET